MTTPDASDAAAFRALEHSGWETVAQPYADVWGALTSQAIEPLLDAVQARGGVRLLDVASGPGYVAGAAAARGAAVVGCDFAAAMVAAARARYPAVEFREGDAEALPFADASFDALTMNFGLLHLGQPERALAEAYRVLRPGGRLGFTVWAPPEQAAGFALVLRAVETHGSLAVPLPPAPPFFRFSDAAESRRVLAGIGFVAPEVSLAAQEWRLPTPEAVFDAMRDATVRTRALLAAQAPAALAAIRVAIRDAAAAYAREGGVVLPMPAVLVAAAKP